MPFTENGCGESLSRAEKLQSRSMPDLTNPAAFQQVMALALELGSSLRLPDLVQGFTARAAGILRARAALLALSQGNVLETVGVHDTRGEIDREILRQIGVRLSEHVRNSSEGLAGVSASGFLGPKLASAVGWSSLDLAKLPSASGDLLGVLCVADPAVPRDEAASLLGAVAAQASVALDNCRLFSRIAQANQHWMEIFDAMDDLIVVHDEDDRVLRVNRSMADAIGASPAELIGISMRALVTFSSARAGQACPFCRRREGDYVHPVLERIYLVSTSRINGALDEGAQTIHVLKDITERREVERRYRELFDNIQEGLFFSTPDGRFVEVNDAFVRMLGYEKRESLLQADIARDIYFSPQHRQRWQEQLEKNGYLRNYEEVLRRRDGTVVHTLQNTFAVRDANEKVIQYRGLILDITEQKRVQTQLQRERDFSSKVLNNTQSLILVSDTAGLVSYANNRCFVALGYQPQDLIGRHLRDFVHSSRQKALDAAIAGNLVGQQVDNLELAIVRTDGTLSQFSANLSPMRDELGDVNSVVIVMTDVTDAVTMQANLRQTEKMAAVGQLVSGVAHEVNNPLTAILGFADLLLENPEIPAAAKTDLNVIVQEAQRTKVIVQNLLSFARQTPAQRQPVELNEIVRKTMQLRSYDFASHNIVALESLQPDLRPIIGDAHQLQQVVLNILNNAYDAVRETGRPGQIEIKTRERDGFDEIIFRDNGPGISHPDRIFDPFFTTKEVGKGTGLGLSICYGIVREHGGEIICHNNGNSAGATFIVRLPIAVAEIARAAVAAAGEAI